MRPIHQSIISRARQLINGTAKKEQYKNGNYQVYKGEDGNVYFKYYYKEIARFNLSTNSLELAIPIYESLLTKQFLNAILEEFDALSYIYRKDWQYYLSHPGETIKLQSNHIPAPQFYDFVPVSEL